MPDNASPKPSAGEVLHLTETLDRGGAGRVVVDLVAALHRHGWRLAVACTTDPGPLSGELTERGIEVLALGKTPGLSPGFVRQLVSLLRKRRPQILHAHMTHVGLYARIAGWVAGVPVVLDHRHSAFGLDRPRWRMIDRLLLPFSKRIITVSNDLTEAYRQKGFPASRITTVVNGIDLARFDGTPSRKDARALLGIPNDTPAFAIVGALEPRKDHRTFFEAACRVAETLNQPSVFLIAGDGPLRSELESFAGEMQSPGAFRFLGEVDEVSLVHRAADAVVSSSVTEGTSVALLEAMALGTPVIATAVGGTPHVLEEGRAGMLVPPREPESLARVMLECLIDSAGTSKRAARARSRIESVFTAGRMARQVAGVYTGLGVVW